MNKTKNSEYWSLLAENAIGDEAALTELYGYFFPRVYQYLLGKTKNPDLADDLVGDAFLRMYQHLDQFDARKGAFSTWLFRIAVNVLNKHFTSKAHAMHETWDEDFDPADEAEKTPEAEIVSKSQNEALRAAIMELPERQRQILEMTYWLDMKSNEIAEQLGMAPSSVRVALKQARDKLRELLEDYRP